MTTMTEVPTLSPAEVAFYREHGWLRTSTVLDPALLDEAQAAIEEHWHGHRDWSLEGARKHFADWMPGDGNGTRNNQYISLQNRRIRQLSWSPTVGRIAAAAAETGSVRLFNDQVVSKPGGQSGAGVGWHVDGDYWGSCTSQSMLTAWIPLHDCPEELGPLVVVDGSHRWSHLLDRSAFSFHSEDMSTLARHVEALGYEFRPVVIEMERGQFSLHHCRTLHGSYPNRSTRPRLATAVHLQDEANRYRPGRRPDGSPVTLFDDRICRRTAEGLPDFTDESVFPTLWRHGGD